MSNININNYLKLVGEQKLEAGKKTTLSEENIQAVFENLDTETIQDINIDENIEALDEAAMSDVNARNEMVAALMDISEVQKAADANGDGEISNDEVVSYLQSLAGPDGKITAENVDKALEELGVDLEAAAEEAVEEVLEEDKTKEAEEAEGLEVTKPTREAEAAGAPAAAGGVPGTTGGGGRTGGTTSPTSGRVNRTGSTDGKAETADEIKQQISEKEGEITNIEADADQQIEEKQQEKEQIMKDAGLSDKAIEEYKEKEQAIETKVKENEQNISKQQDIIGDCDSSIASNENFIADIDSQISANESKRSAIASDDKDAASKNAEIDSMISNLQAQKEAKEKENDELKDKKEAAEQEKAQLEEQKTQFEQEKTALNREMMETAGGPGSPRATEMFGKLQEADKNISEIRTQKNEQVSEIKNEITDLQVKLKDAEQKEERDGFLNDNEFYDGSVPSELASVIDQKCGAGFTQKLEEMCKRLNCDPTDMLGMMFSESGLNPQAVNSNGGATGLIQFMPSTARGLGTSTEELANMSAIEQLDWVEKYYAGNLKAIGMDDGRHLEAGTLYAITFLPGYANREVLCSSTGDTAKYYNPNSGLDLDGDGNITISDLTQRVKGKYESMYNAWT